MSDLPNAADRKSIRAAEKAARLRERERAEVVTSIMSTRAGRSWLWDRLSETSIFSTTHVAADPLGSAFQEGRRSVGLSLLADIMAHCPDQFINAMREHNERHQHNDHTAPDSDSAPLAERRSSPQPDGGDSGAESDRTETPGPAGPEAGWNPGLDIYIEAPSR